MEPIELITKEQWPSFVGNDPGAEFTYVQVTNDITTHVKTLVDKWITFDDLKKELIAFYEERQEFVKFANECRY